MSDRWVVCCLSFSRDNGNLVKSWCVTTSNTLRMRKIKSGRMQRRHFKSNQQNWRSCPVKDLGLNLMSDWGLYVCVKLDYLVLVNPSHPKHACRMCYCCCLQVHLQATSTFTNKLWQLDRQNPGEKQQEKKSMSSTAQLFKITALRALAHVFVRRSFIWFGQVEH